MKQRRWFWTSLATLVVCGAGLAISVGYAQGTAPASVAIGTMQTRGPGTRLLQSVMRDEMNRMDGMQLRSRQRANFLIQGAVVRFDESSGGIDCEVSLTLSERRTGAVRAIASGNARTENADARLREPVLRAALRGALRNLAGHVHQAAHRR